MSTEAANNPRVGSDSEAQGIQDPVYDPGTVALSESLKREKPTLTEVLGKYNIVDAYPEQGFIVVADRQEKLTDTIGTTPTVELGSSSPSPWTSWIRDEYVPELRDQQGLVQYYRMVRNDGAIRSSLRLFKTPPTAARWFIKPASDSAIDKRIATFVADNIFNKLNVTWPTLLGDILLMCNYGFMIFEKVWTVCSDGKVRLKKLGPRHPADIRDWLFDANGGPSGIVLEPMENSITGEGVTIPIDKLVIFSFEPEAGDLKGTSVLRSVYKHWYYKDTLYKIDAIQKERHGIGVPVIKLPTGYSSQDKIAAEELGSNLRTNERAHVVLPPGWDLIFAKVEGQLVDCMKSIEHHDMAIAINVLGPFLKEPKVDTASTDLFYKAARTLALYVTAIFNRFIIPQLVDYNFRLGTNRSYPQLMARRIGEWNDIRTQTFALRNLAGAGFLRPDDTVETVLREDLDLPPMDPETLRDPLHPSEEVNEEDDDLASRRQRGAKAGLPRQQPLPPTKQRSNAGVDRSGEK